MKRGPRGLIRLQCVLFISITLLISSSGCGGGGSSTPPTPAPVASLTSITVAPGTSNIALGLMLQFSAKGTYSDGSTKDLTSAATWTSSATDVLTISASGLATSKTQGNVTVSAASGGASGSGVVTVGPPQLTGIAISPSAIFVARRSSQQFTATGSYTDGTTQDLTSTVSWNLTNPYIARGTIGSAVRSGSAAFKADSAASDAYTADTQRDGFTAVSASSGAVSASAKLTVVSPSRFAYVSDSGADSVSFYTLDSSTGDLRMRGYKSTMPPMQSVHSSTDCVTIDPSGSFVYAANPEFPPATGNISIFRLNPVNGALTELAGSPFSSTVPLNCLQFEPSGKFGYAVSYWSGAHQLAGYSRDATTGLLTELPWSPMTVGDSPTGMAIDPIGQFLYFVNMEISTGKPTSIDGYSIDPDTGELTPITGMPLFVSNTTQSISIVHPSGNYAYISHGQGKTIDVYKIDRTSGTLSLVPGSTITTAVNPSSLVFSVDGSYAYMNVSMTNLGDITSGGITTFHVDDATGKLTEIGTTPAGTLPGALTVDSSGQFLYSSDNSWYLRVYKLQPDGTPKYVRSIATRPSPMNIALLAGETPVTYTPTSVQVTTAGDNLLTGYAIGSDGTLTSAGSIGTPATPNSLALLPWGTNALVTATGAPPTSNMGAYTINPITGSPAYGLFMGDAAVAGGVVIEPGEGYAFQSDSSAGVLRTYGHFASSSWGLLAYDPGNGTLYSTFPAGAGAGPMATVPSGRYLYVANQGANSITAFAFWGELFEMTSTFVGSGYSDASPYSIGAEPIAIAADPMGLYLYVVCDDKTVRVYSIDSWAGGHLKKVASEVLAATPTTVSVDLTGHFIYVGDASGGVSPFGVDPLTGTLNALTPSVLPAAVTAISLESSGQFAYVLCGPTGGASGNTGTINAFKVNTDGTLTSLPTGPWLANHPSAIAFTDAVQ
jgi:6-phosphogluconolactonase